MKIKRNKRRLSHNVIQTCRIFVAPIFVSIIGSLLFIQKGFVDKEKKPIIFELFSKDKNASIQTTLTKEMGKRNHARNLFNVKESPLWEIRYIDLYFYVKLNVEDQLYDLMIDTGSTLSWLNCKVMDMSPHPRTNLGKLNQLYKPNFDKFVSKESPLCTLLDDRYGGADQISHGGFKHCGYYILYVDNSFAKGVLVEDTIVYKRFMEGDADQLNVNFGCTYEFESEAPVIDGLLGLEHFEGLSLSSQFKTKLGVHDIFSLCISFKDSTFVTGYLMFGYDVSKFQDVISWVPIKKAYISRARHLEMHELYYGRKVLFRNDKASIRFDTGSLATHMRIDLYAGLVFEVMASAERHEYETVHQNGDYNYDTCWKVDSTKISPAQVFDEIVFKFQDGVAFVISPINYIKLVDEDHHCLVLFEDEDALSSEESAKAEESTKEESAQNEDSEESIEPPIVTIGALWMNNKLIIFDNEKHLIGFAESNCVLPNNKKRKRDPSLAGPST